MHITISDSARAKLSELLAARGGGTSIRLGLRSGGCKGFEQLIDLMPLITQDDEIIDANGLSIIIDKKSSVLLNGLVLEWVSSLTEKRFVFTFPSKKSACSCGSSFSI
jgi:iron-sulfur cluster assembly protein